MNELAANVHQQWCFSQLGSKLPRLNCDYIFTPMNPLMIVTPENVFHSLSSWSKHNVAKSSRDQTAFAGENIGLPLLMCKIFSQWFIKYQKNCLRFSFISEAWRSNVCLMEIKNGTPYKNMNLFDTWPRNAAVKNLFHIFLVDTPHHNIVLWCFIMLILLSIIRIVYSPQNGILILLLLLCFLNVLVLIMLL